MCVALSSSLVRPVPVCSQPHDVPPAAQVPGEFIENGVWFLSLSFGFVVMLVAIYLVCTLPYMKAKRKGK